MFFLISVLLDDQTTSSLVVGSTSLSPFNQTKRENNEGLITHVLAGQKKCTIRLRFTFYIRDHKEEDTREMKRAYA